MQTADDARSGRTDQLLTLARAFALLWLLSITFSIAIAEAALWLAAAAWGASWLRRELATDALDSERSGPSPAGDALGFVGAPIIAFFAISLLSAMLSRQRVEALLELREVFLFAAPLVTWAVFRDATARRRGRWIFAAGVGGAVLVGMYQAFAMAPAPGDAVYRATGPLGHYMTYSGVLMVSIPLLLSIRSGIPRLLSYTVAVFAAATIALTLTRSAWIGCITALLVYFVSRFVGRGAAIPDGGMPRERRAFLVLAGLGALVIIVLVAGALVDPDALYDRAASTFSLDDASNRDRIAMAATGFRLIRAYPFLGIGPGLMERVYPAWVVDWAVREQNPHLHNNLLQIAAERGLLGLAAWLWMMAAFAIGAGRVLRVAGPAGPGGPEARAALAALAGFLAMGMFEYNFSDSEVLMALLYVASLPLAASTTS